MERLFMTADDVAEVLGVSKRTAYTYITQMEHIDRPRRATARGFQEWVRARTAAPGGKAAREEKNAPARMRRRRGREEMTAAADFRIPRRRAAE